MQAGSLMPVLAVLADRPNAQNVGCDLTVLSHPQDNLLSSQSLCYVPACFLGSGDKVIPVDIGFRTHLALEDNNAGSRAGASSFRSSAVFRLHIAVHHPSFQPPPQVTRHKWAGIA